MDKCFFPQTSGCFWKFFPLWKSCSENNKTKKEAFVWFPQNLFVWGILLTVQKVFFFYIINNIKVIVCFTFFFKWHCCCDKLRLRFTHFAKIPYPENTNLLNFVDFLQVWANPYQSPYRQLSKLHFHYRYLKPFF